MTMSVTFLGAAQNVTGSCYAVAAAASTVLVDCGLYQERDLKARNWEAFPVPPASLRAVLLTHAHLDHCGLLPKLVRDGFRGPIYCTPATAEIAGIVLLDSAKLQEEDAAVKARRHAKAGRRGPYPDKPLYTIQDAEAVLPRFTPVEYGQAVTVAADITAVFHEAGHILGSSMIKLTLREPPVERTILFSGDLGRIDIPLLRDPERRFSADSVVIESTYGDRLHEATADVPDELARIINETTQAGGKTLIPAFAIERTQELLYYLNGLLRAGKIPRLPIFLDSPMAIKITKVFSRHPELFDADTLALLQKGVSPYEFPGLTFTATVEESKAINKVKGPAIVIAGSGMCNGGRIKHHLVNNISSSKTTVLFSGYQALGTLGREILDGAKRVRILGLQYQVKARIVQLSGMSAHADRDELLAWLLALPQPPRQVFVTHGEAASANSFVQFVREKTGWNASAPAYNQRMELDGGRPHGNP
jgi:metallo-beta-lactamase family protein